MRLPSDAKLKKSGINQFFPLWGLGIGIIGLIAILLFFFPFNVIYNRFLKQQQVDYISQLYLKELVDIYPDNMQFRFLLAKHHVTVGEVESARELVEPLIKENPNSKRAWQAQWLLYQILRTETYALPEDSPERAEGLKDMRKAIKLLLTGPITASQLVKLANESEKIGDPELATKIYQRILDEKPKLPADVYANGGRIALSTSNYQTSAGLYLLAEQAATTDADRLKYYLLALKSMVASGKNTPELHQTLARAATYPIEGKTSIELTKVALGAN